MRAPNERLPQTADAAAEFSRPKKKEAGTVQAVKFEERPAMRVLGIQRRLDPRKTDWGALWQGEYGPHLLEIEARSTGDTCLGIYMPGGSDGLVEFVAGRLARDGIDVPAGLALCDIPPATYAVFECTMAAIGATWGAIYGEWLPNSAYVIDAGKACFEAFAPGCHEGRTPVRISVPVVPRA